MKLLFKKHIQSKRNPYQKQLKYFISFTYSSIRECITGSREFFSLGFRCHECIIDAGALTEAVSHIIGDPLASWFLV